MEESVITENQTPLPYTTQQNFSFVQTESIRRPQTLSYSKHKISFSHGFRHCVKCWTPAFSPFLQCFQKVFS